MTTRCKCMGNFVIGLLFMVSFLSQPARADMVKIVVNDTINPITLEYIDRALEEAAKQHADALIIELRTPGGLLDSTRSIIEKIGVSYR